MPPGVELLDAGHLVRIDLAQDLLQPGIDGQEVGRREHRESGDLADLLLSQVVEFVESDDDIALEQDPVERLAGALNIDRAAADPEAATLKLGVIAGILEADQMVQEGLSADRFSLSQDEGVLAVLLRRAETIDAAHRRNDQHVPSRQERLGRPVAELVDLLVDRGVLLDVEVDLGDVGFRLVIVVIADEIFDGVPREERPELAHELRGECLIVGDDQRRPLKLLDYVGHRERFAGAGHTEQRFVALPGPEPTDQLGDRLRLVPLRRQLRVELELLGRVHPGRRSAPELGSASSRRHAFNRGR